jgi:hypothetical protein
MIEDEISSIIESGDKTLIQAFIRDIINENYNLKNQFDLVRSHLDQSL